LGFLHDEKRVAAYTGMAIQDPPRKQGEMGIGLRGDLLGIEHHDVVAATLHLEEIDLHRVRRYTDSCREARGCGSLRAR
jgi:hypothetical protein